MAEAQNEFDRFQGELNKQRENEANAVAIDRDDDENEHQQPQSCSLAEDSSTNKGDNKMNVSNDLSQFLEKLLLENQRKDALLEKLIDKISDREVLTQKPQNIGVMPGLLSNIASFDGNSLKAKEWLQSLNSAQILHNIPDNYILETARTKLTDGAYHWYQVRKSKIHSWQDFIENFEPTFIMEEPTSDKYKRMTQRIQGKRESLNSYFHEKVRMCEELKFSFCELKREILIGVWSRTLCEAMMAKQHFTTDHLLHDMHKFLNIESKRVGRMALMHNRPVEKVTRH